MGDKSFLWAAGAKGFRFSYREPMMPFKLHSKGRRHIPRQRHRVTNWREYDASLRNRGSLTVWFTPDAIAGWKAQPRTTPGGQRHYSDLAIETALTLRAVFRLALRQSEGLIGSIMNAGDQSAGSRSHDAEPAGVRIAGSNAPEKQDRRSSLDRR
jgi:hypothetical protein